MDPGTLVGKVKAHSAVRVCLTALMLSVSTPTFCSSAGFSLVGPMSSTGSTDTGLREIVELRSLGGGLFAGRPENPLIPIITVLADDGSSLWLIIREFGGSGEEKFLLLTASNSFSKRITRLTLYLSPDIQAPILHESLDERWHLRYGHRVTTEIAHPTVGEEKIALYAYSLPGLGHYRLRQSSKHWTATSDPTPSKATNANGLLGGSALQGFKTWAYALGLLLAISLLSSLLHGRESMSD